MAILTFIFTACAKPIGVEKCGSGLSQMELPIVYVPLAGRNQEGKMETFNNNAGMCCPISEGRVPIDPEVPSHLFHTRLADWTPAEKNQWWRRPYIVTRRLSPPSHKPRGWDEAYPEGVLYTVLCLDCDVLGRATIYGFDGILDTAIAIARKPRRQSQTTAIGYQSEFNWLRRIPTFRSAFVSFDGRPWETK